MRTITTATPPPPELMAGWPDWLVVLVALVAVVVGIWILGKLLKLAIWLLIVATVVVGVLAVVGMLLRL